jgi:hypothetical protein
MLIKQMVPLVANHQRHICHRQQFAITARVCCVDSHVFNVPDVGVPDIKPVAVLIC